MTDFAPRPVVSMCCLTYNQAATIAQCLDSMLMQVVDVPVEIVVHDDASTDGTAEIVADYADRHPTLIRTILQTTNQYGGASTHPVVLLLEAARGDYVALCEGDDYWTDTRKISIQFDALNAHGQIDICGHDARVLRINEASRSVEERIQGYPGGIYTPQQVAMKEDVKIATASLFFRRSVATTFSEFMRSRHRDIGDLYLKILGARRGGLLYLPKAMAAYRQNNPGSWSRNISDNGESRLAAAKSKIEGLSDLQRHVGGAFVITAASVKLRTLYWVLQDSTLRPYVRACFLLQQARHLISYAVLRAAARRLTRWSRP